MKANKTAGFVGTVPECSNPRYSRVNGYVRKRLIILAKHTSQRGYKLKYAQTYYYEWKAMGLYEMRKRRP